MQEAQKPPEHVDLVVRDWEGVRSATLEAVLTSTTVGEVVTEVVRALELPLRTFYQAVLQGRQLAHTDTLAEAGVTQDEELELVPEMSAGGSERG